MRLYYTPNSPYARMCRITAELNGLTDELELINVPLRSEDSPILTLSPLGRIPLLTDGDLTLSEARHICAYLDRKGSGASVVAAYDDWQAVAREAEALAFLDAVTVWSREIRRAKGEQSPFLLEVEETQARRELAHLDGKLVPPAGDPPMNFETICLLTALGMMRFYELVPDWRDSYPTVAAWSDAYDKIPIVADTLPSAAAMNPLTR